MGFELIRARILVLPDEGKDTQGMIVLDELFGYACLGIVPEQPENPEDPIGVPVRCNHVVFTKEGAVEVEIDGVTYLAMHRNNIVGIITD